MALDDHELGLAVPAVETGTMNRSASILIQAGFNSRLAAIKAVTDTGRDLHDRSRASAMAQLGRYCGLERAARLAHGRNEGDVDGVCRELHAARQSHLD